MARDRAQLKRFLSWAEAKPAESLGVLFTPWGEALIRPWYQEAILALSHLPWVERVAIQTNLSGPLAWAEAADREALALWATFHPGQVSRARFLAKCRELDALGVRYSVGGVGLREHFAELEALRAELAPSVYLWINAYKRDPDYYRPGERERLTALDPLFSQNATRHASRGEACRTGASVISVDGEGTIRRCHFVKEPLGSLYAPAWEQALAERPCPNERCGCFIGYAHLERLRLEETFGASLLERIPRVLPRALGVAPGQHQETSA